MKKVKKPLTAPNTDFTKQMIAKAKSRIQPRQKVVIPSGTRQPQQPDIFERQLTSLEMELTGALKVNASKGKSIRDKLRHDGSRGDLASAYLTYDFENKLKALENILSSENMSEMGCAQIRSLAADFLISGVSIGIALTRANNVLGQEIETQMPREAGKESGKSRQRTAQDKDSEFSEWAKPHILPNKKIEENIRRLQKLEAKEGRLRAGVARIRRVVKTLLPPKKTLKKA